MSPIQILRSLAPVTAAALLLQGCFIFVDDFDDDDDDDYEPPPAVNYEPEIDSAETWWFCDYDEGADDYFFEFQASVRDPDGDWDVQYVDVTVYRADTDLEFGSWSLMDEGDGIWGGLVWERESELYCGEPVDVVFETWDYDGAYDSMTLWY